jgi:chromosome segregation ATPase
MSDLIAALNTLNQYEVMLKKLQDAIKEAMPCEQAVKEHDRAMRENMRQLDAIKDEMIVRQNGVLQFKQHAQEERDREIQRLDADRRERVAILTTENQRLSAVRFAIEQATRELDEVRQEKRRADEELAKISRLVGEAAENFTALRRA